MEKLATTLGIDYGQRKFGLSISDETGLIASPLPVLHVKSDEEALTAIVRLVRDRSVQAIVLGVPSGWEDKDSPQTTVVRNFKTKLEQATGMSVATWDESYSTKQAEAGARGRKREQSDSEAARIILQEYLDYLQDEGREMAPWA